MLANARKFNNRFLSISITRHGVIYRRTGWDYWTPYVVSYAVISNIHGADTYITKADRLIKVETSAPRNREPRDARVPNTRVCVPRYRRSNYFG